MNNLKRIFSLALATVMVLGMMVVGASATSFPDDADIENKTAVETMNALGIIGGREDGSFDPKATVNRAEMAKMICFALNGGKDINYGLKNNNSFKDVKGTDWFAEYVEYCYSLGIVGGRGDGTFDPYAKVTGQEAAKMVLVALGYDADIFSFGGPNWAANVDYIAENLTVGDELKGDDGKGTGEWNGTSLYNNVAGLRTVALTRDDAAQLIYNGLNANTVTKSITGIQNGAPLYTFNMHNDSLLESKFKATVATGTLNSSKYDAKTGNYTYNITVGKNTDNYVTSIDVTESWKRSVRVVYQGSGSNKKVLAISSASSINTSGVVGTAEFETDSEGVTTLDGRELADAKALTVYAINKDTAITGAYVAATDKVEAHFDAGKIGGAWYNYSLLTNRDGEVTGVIVYPTVVEKVTKVDKGVVTTDKGSYTISASKPQNVTATTSDELEAGDYVLVSNKERINNMPIKLESQTVLTEQVATAVDTTTKIYTIGGNKYLLAGDAKIDETKGLGLAYDLVIVNGYVLVASNEKAPTALGVDNVLYISEVGKVADSGKDELGNGTDKIQKVRVVFTDGTTKVIDVAYLGLDKDKKPVRVGDENLLVEKNEDTLYSFTEKDGEYSLVALDAKELLDFEANDKTLTENKILAGGKSGSIRFASDAVLFVKYTSGKNTVVDVMTGADINGWKSTATVTSHKLFTDKNKTTGFDTVGFGIIDLGTNNLPGAQDQVGNYGYLLTNPVNVWNAEAEETQKQITLWDGTNEVTYYVTANTELAAGDAIEFTLKGDVITAATVLTGKAAVSQYDGEVIRFHGETKTYAITDDTVVIYIDSAEGEGRASGEIKLAALAEDEKKYVNNVIVEAGKTTTADGATKIVVLFVDVNNKIG